MKSTFRILSFLCVTGVASAANVSISTGTPAQAVKLSNGEAAPANSLVLVGFFQNYGTVGDAGIKAGVANTYGAELSNFLTTNFVPLGYSSSAIFSLSGISGAKFGDFNGSTPPATRVDAVSGVTTITGGVTNITFSSDPANTFNANGLARGTRLFLMVFDSGSIETSRELGIFSADSNWTVPTSSFISSANLVLTNVDTAAEVYRGAVGSLVLKSINVPEPVSGGLLAMGAAALLRRRRR